MKENAQIRHLKIQISILDAKHAVHHVKLVKNLLNVQAVVSVTYTKNHVYQVFLI